MMRVRSIMLVTTFDTLPRSPLISSQMYETEEPSLRLTTAYYFLSTSSTSAQS